MPAGIKIKEFPLFHNKSRALLFGSVDRGCFLALLGEFKVELITPEISKEIRRQRVKQWYSRNRSEVILKYRAYNRKRVGDPRTAPHIIYALSDPTEEKILENVRYVGKTWTPPLDLRLNAHLSKKDGTHRARWIQKLKSKCLTPIIWALEECTPETWEEKEREWISRLKQYGRLTNTAPGGKSGPVGPMPESQKIKVSIAKRGQTISLEARRRISAKLTGIRRSEVSESTRQKMRLAKLGKKHTQSHRDAIGRAHKGIKHSPEWIAKRTQWMRDRNWKPTHLLSPDIQEKRRIASIGRKMSDSQRAYLSKVNSKSVVCVETGEVYESIKKAEGYISRKNISRAILKGLTCGGFHWKYVETDAS